VLEDGDRIDLGGGVELTVVHTPGHTPGSVSYYWEAEKLLLTGDSVQARGFKPGGYPLYFDSQAYGQSMQRLKDLPIETIGMGHGFISGVHLNAPVKYGDEARHMVEESALVHATIDRTTRKLAAELPDASLLELAQRTTMELIGALPTHVDPRIGLPLSGGPTLWSHASVARAAAS
jgi:glyoxylase-like metal-dependent hydrolase (beta-lactamase superfamily II)